MVVPQELFVTDSPSALKLKRLVAAQLPQWLSEKCSATLLACRSQQSPAFCTQPVLLQSAVRFFRDGTSKSNRLCGSAIKDRNIQKTCSLTCSPTCSPTCPNWVDSDFRDCSRESGKGDADGSFMYVRHFLFSWKLLLAKKYLRVRQPLSLFSLYTCNMIQ